MRIIDLLYLVVQGLKSRIARTLYTTLGVAIGIAAILFLVSLGYGLQKILLEKITTKESLLTLDVASPESKIISLNDATLQKISKIPGVDQISPQAVFIGQIVHEGLTSEAIVNLIDPNFFIYEGITPRFGRLLTADEKNKLIVDSQVAELFGLKNSKILGKNLKILIFIPVEGAEEGIVETFEVETEFEVTGVIEGGATTANIFLKRDDLEKLPIKEYQFAKVKVEEDKNLEEARDKLISMGFMVSALSDTIEQANRIFNAIQIILGIFGVVGLIVAAVGLVNTMSITLLERTSEIGIMRSLGASANDIRKLFLMESTICGFFGGIFGVTLGIGIGQLFNFGINLLAKSLGGQTMRLFSYPFWFI
ncbi:MAG: hypothetical protein COU98_00390, partial [Candidatus Staskawiczbacteria bacterium CG10_big_fil_rev_8_21_14_0_10_38_10]